MAQDRERTHRRLDELWRDPGVPTLALADHPRLVVVSDLHLGDGGDADDLRRNRFALEAALREYAAGGFTVILLGDIEELWQFDLDRIVARYDDTVYADLRRFGEERVLRVFGNHDSEWSSPPDPATGAAVGRGVPEALRLATADGPRVLLVHGHQGSLDSDRNSWFSRFVVRGLFKPVEPLARVLGLYRHPSATKSMVMEDYERVMYDWAKSRRVVLVCGHSHRAIWASRPYAEILRKQIDELEGRRRSSRRAADAVELDARIQVRRRELEDEREKGRDIGPLDPGNEPSPCYFNDGCGLYTDGVTALELDGDRLALVRWSRKTLQKDLLQDGSLEDILDAV